MWFMWDTGASLTVLNRDLAAKLGVTLHGDLGLGTSGGSTGMSIVKGVTYKIGERGSSTSTRAPSR